jgi:hypothetical protein
MHAHGSVLFRLRRARVRLTGGSRPLDSLAGRPFHPAVLEKDAVRKAKYPMGLTTGHFVLATSYSRTAYRRTTIGAAAFHFRVRNGNGWYHYANVTRILRRILRRRILVK